MHNLIYFPNTFCTYFFLMKETDNINKVRTENP